MHVAMHITHNKIPSCPKGEEGSRIGRCAGKGFEFFRRDFSFESGLLQDLGYLFIFLVFFLGPLPFFLLRLLYRHSRASLSLSEFVLTSDLLSLSFLLFFLSLADTSTSLVVISRRPTTAFNRTWRSPSCW